MNSDILGLFDDPPRRRWWLLVKALKDAPLREALTLSMAAEIFLTARKNALEQELADDPLSADQLSTRIH